MKCSNIIFLDSLQTQLIPLWKILNKHHKYKHLNQLGLSQQHSATTIYYNWDALCRLNGKFISWNTESNSNFKLHTKQIWRKNNCTIPFYIRHMTLNCNTSYIGKKNIKLIWIVSQITVTMSFFTMDIFLKYKN